MVVSVIFRLYFLKIKKQILAGIEYFNWTKLKFNPDTNTLEPEHLGLRSSEAGAKSW